MENHLKRLVEYRDTFLPYQRRITLCLVLISLFLSFNTKYCIAVPAVPNESVIEGTVQEFSIVSSNLLNIMPEQTLYRLTILIESYENADTDADYLSDKKGKTVQLYSKEKISPEIFGKRVWVKVRYAGDERGGLYWIKEISMIPVK
ncbi:MAG TPA: hypothetical protein VFF47_06615 [Nitrospirota bacterium]|nr:hypothetical protein [Nitrospirota bacterium]